LGTYIFWNVPEISSGKTTSYEYDKAGNRAKETVTEGENTVVTEGENTVVTTYTYNEQERLMQVVWGRACFCTF